MHRRREKMAHLGEKHFTTYLAENISNASMWIFFYSWRDTPVWCGKISGRIFFQKLFCSGPFSPKFSLSWKVQRIRPIMRIVRYLLIFSLTLIFSVARVCNFGWAILFLKNFLYRRGNIEETEPLFLQANSPVFWIGTSEMSQMKANDILN